MKLDSHSDCISESPTIKSNIFRYVCCVGLTYLSACLCTVTHDVSASSPLNCSAENTGMVIITTQMQLDNFIQSILSSGSQTMDSLCLIFNEGDFLLDLPQLMKINLGTNGSLVIMTNGNVTINCTTSVSDPEMLRRTVQPISRMLLISFDGLVFTECPVPILIEEASIVMILNCVFM